MKFEIFFIISAVALTCSAASTEVESSKCALCSNFVELMNSGELETIPSEYLEFLDEDNLNSCLASCTADYETQGDSNSLGVDTVELISMVGCTTCTQIIEGITSHLFSFDYGSIMRAVKHSCSLIDGFVKTARCKAFVNLRKKEIVEAVFRYHMDPQAACLKLKQC